MNEFIKKMQKFIATKYQQGHKFVDVLASENEVINHIDELKQFNVESIIFNSKNKGIRISKDDRRKILFLNAFSVKTTQKRILVLISSEVKKEQRKQLADKYSNHSDKYEQISTVRTPRKVCALRGHI